MVTRLSLVPAGMTSKQCFWKITYPTFKQLCWTVNNNITKPSSWIFFRTNKQNIYIFFFRFSGWNMTQTFTLVICYHTLSWGFCPIFIEAGLTSMPSSHNHWFWLKVSQIDIWKSESAEGKQSGLIPSPVHLLLENAVQVFTHSFLCDLRVGGLEWLSDFF